MRTAARICALVLLVACASEPNDGGQATGSPATHPTRNGAIAFIRIDPDDVSGDGTIPAAKLMVSNPHGREHAVATASQAPPAWSPDGSMLAYVGGGGIWTIEPGSRPRRLTRCDPATCVGDGPPSWSPDARTVAFGSARNGSEGLWTVSAEGGDPMLLAEDLAVRGAPTWSPDGATIAVVASRGAGGSAVVLLGAENGTVRSTLAPDGVVFGSSVGWSPDGSRFVVSAAVDGQAGGDEAVYVMGIDGSSLRLLTSCGGQACIDLWPAWSPDGSKVLFTHGRCDDPGSDCTLGDLYVTPVTGGPIQQVTQGAPLACCGAWQPIPAG
jgi:TolB protein